MASALFSPIRLGGLELANRVAVSPMCQYSAENGEASDWHMTHLGMLANSGAALVVVEMTDVEPQGRITRNCLGLYSDACEAALARVIAHCKKIGSARFGIQLAHAGRKASAMPAWDRSKPLAPGDGGWESIGPSAISFGAGWQVPREMSDADMNRVRDGFLSSAKRAVRAGIDAIELHMAHGYLLHSFMSPISNRRTDGYGGSLEARARFPLEVTKTVRSAMPKDMPLGARITGSDWLDGGITPDDAVVYAAMLKDAGLDFVDVSSGAQKVGGITLASRTRAAAERIAAPVSADVVDWSDMPAALEQADILVTATGAASTILSRADVERVMRARRERPLFIIDIAVPRVVDSDAGDVEQVFLYNIDDLQGIVKENLARRTAELERADAIVAAETARFARWLQSREVIPTVVALRERFEAIRRAELQRLQPRLSSLPPEAQAQVDQITRLIVEKLLLTPTEQLKAVGDDSLAAAYSDALNRLFSLPSPGEPRSPQATAEKPASTRTRP
jgi:NADPH2 dehydrogenase